MKEKKSLFIEGIILALLGAVCFSTKAIFVKLAYRDTVIDAVSLLALRMIFSLPFFIGSAYLFSAKSNNVRFALSQWFWVALIGCLGYYISSLLDFIGLQYVSAGLERLILFIYPTIAMLMSSAIFKSKIKPVQWVALAITYLGLAFAFFNEVDFSNEENKNLVFGAVCIFVCAITYASYMVGSGRLIPIVGASKFNSYAMSFACAGVLIHHFIVNSSRSLLHFSTIAYVYSFLMAIVGTVIPSYLVTAGVKRIGPDNTAVIGSIGPVSTLFMAYLFLDEKIAASQMVGTAFILVGVLLIGKQKQ
jgi:drug/metabolite transporter (DMT)-like permease